jgi:ABC-2 type transport system permease protein
VSDASPGRRNTSWRRLRLIAARELRERFAQRAYLIALLVGALLAAAAIALPTLLGASDDEPSTERVVVAFDGAQGGDARTRAQALGATVRQQGNAEIRIQLESPAAARRLVQDGDKDFALVVRGTAAAPAVTVLGREGGLSDPAPVLRGLERVALEARVDAVAPSLRAQVLAPLSVQATTVPSSGPNNAATAVVSVFGLVIYIAGLMLMTAYATGIVSDRAGRVTERLLTAAQPHEHLGGKLIGVGAAGLLQVASWIAGGAVAAAVLGSSVGDAFSGVPVGLVVYFPVAVALTYISYAALATVLILPVRKTEDVGAALAPATMIQVVTFILASSNIRPGAAIPHIVEVLSFVPFFSPLLMLLRVGSGGVASWEIVLATLITLVTSAVIIRLAAPAYARYAIEAPGGKGLGAAFKALRR